MHQTDCEPVLEKIGIEYDSDEKFNTKVIMREGTLHNLVNA
jgi:hypothetical protein